MKVRKKTTRLAKAHLFAIFASFLMPTTALHADTFYVSPGEDIQTVIDGAADGDTVLLQPGAHVLTSEISITNGITLGSVASHTNTIVDGSNTTRCLYINHANCVIDDLKITRGYTTNQSGAGVYCASGIVQNCLITSNAVAYNGDEYVGGGAYCTDSGILSNCVIRGNTASYAGGTCCNNQAMIRDCWIGYNTATNYGGGVYCRATVQNCVIVSNSASNGGGVYCSQGVVRDCTINSNSASGYGGGVYCRSLVENCTIIRNSAASDGGGSYCYAGGVFRFCTIYLNSAPKNADWDSSGKYEQCSSAPAPDGIENMLITGFDETNSVVDISPVSDEGYAFHYWEIDGFYEGTNVPFSQCIDPPRRIKPIFIPEMSSSTQTFENAKGAEYDGGWVEGGFFFQTPQGIVRRTYTSTHYPYNDGTFLPFMSSYEPLVITNIHGIAFALSTVDLAEYSTVFSVYQVPFVGHCVDGSTVNTTFYLDGMINGDTHDYQRFVFPSSFTNLVLVEVPETGYSMDNLVILLANADDTDADGMDDKWEISYFGHRSFDGTGDFDGDRSRDGDEFVAGTNPTNMNDCFIINSAATETNELFVMYWQSVTGRVYSVFSTTNLLCAWTNTYSCPGDGFLMSYTNIDNTADSVFFRLGVELE